MTYTVEARNLNKRILSELLDTAGYGGAVIGTIREGQTYRRVVVRVNRGRGVRRRKVVVKNRG